MQARERLGRSSASVPVAVSSRGLCSGDSPLALGRPLWGPNGAPSARRSGAQSRRQCLQAADLGSRQGHANPGHPNLGQQPCWIAVRVKRIALNRGGP
jgi:hypothetical protein